MGRKRSWKKYILHLVRPLHILKSPGKPTKNILGLRNNKRRVHMHIHTQPVGSPVASVSIQGFHTYPDTEGGPKAEVFPLFSPIRCWPSFIAGRTERRLPRSEIWGHFRHTTCSLLALPGLSSGLLTAQNPKADQIDTFKPYSLKTEGERFKIGHSSLV